MSQFRKVHRVLAFLSFLASFAVYYLTCYPSISFGESGGLAAAAWYQQVPAAPGAPLWVIVAGAFTRLLPGDPAFTLTLFSALCGAATAMVVYTIAVTLGSMLADNLGEEDSPAAETVSREGITVLVGGLIAGLSFAWFDSQWSNATQITTRSAGTFLVALVILSALKWYRSHRNGTPGGLRWLLLAAYATGLTLGVDHPALDLIPGVIMLVWVGCVVPDGEEGRYTLGALLAMVGLLLLRYALGVYAPYAFLPLLLVALVGAGIAAAVPKVREAAVAGAFLLIFVLLGYSAYTQTALRSQAGPVQNMMETAGLQGTPDLLPYIHTSPTSTARIAVGQGEADRQENSSLRRQVGHFYIRYLLWNTVGRAGSVPNAPAAWFGVSDETRHAFIPATDREGIFPVQFFALPLLLALIGLVINFRTDWRSGVVLLTFFLAVGPLSAVVWGWNMPPGTSDDPDGMAASSLLVVALWIGLGAAGLARTAGEWRRRQGEDDAARAQGDNLANGLLLLCFFLAPINLLYNGWDAHNHSNNRLPHDFAHNLLLSCDSNAILFVEDARPLQYVQDVEAVRRDVRVVDLHLAGQEWYRRWLRTENAWDAAAVPANISEGIAIGELKGHPRRKGAALGPYLSDSVETIVLHSHNTSGTADSLLWQWQGIPDSTGKIRYTVPLRLIRGIVEGNSQNRRHRPVYFAVNVSPALWGGLEKFFRWEGILFRVVPENGLHGIGGYSDFPVDESRTKELLSNQLLFTPLNPETTTVTQAERRIILLYRRAFIALAATELKSKNAPQECAAVLQAMDRALPPELFALPYWEAAAVASLGKEAGDKTTVAKYARHAIDGVERLGEGWRANPIARRYNPYQTTARMYAMLGEYDKAIAAYRAAQQDWQRDPVLRGLVEELRVERHLTSGDTAAGIAELRKIIDEYGTPGNPEMLSNRDAWKEMLEDLEGKGQAHTTPH